MKNRPRRRRARALLVASTGLIALTLSACDEPIGNPGIDLGCTTSSTAPQCGNDLSVPIDMKIGD